MAQEARNPEWLLAEEISRRRRAMGITAQQLADRIAAGGGKLSRQAISKVENHDRAVAIEELLHLARALEVPPILLLFPVGLVDEVEVLPDRANPAWDCAKWFMGDIATSTDPADIDAWHRGAAPISWHRRHDELQNMWNLVSRYVVDARAGMRSADSDNDRETFRRRVEEEEARLAGVEERWRDVRLAIRQLGLTPPPLPRVAVHIDSPAGEKGGAD